MATYVYVLGLALEGFQEGRNQTVNLHRCGQERGELTLSFVLGRTRVRESLAFL
jgi:hypothetical protein